MEHKYDVIVVGGGATGSMAAIAAARCGADTLVAEQSIKRYSGSRRAAKNRDIANATTTYRVDLT